MKTLTFLASATLALAAPQKGPTNWTSYPGAAPVPTSPANPNHQPQVCIILSNGYSNDTRDGIFAQNLCFQDRPQYPSNFCSISRLPDNLRGNVSMISIPPGEFCTLYGEENCQGASWQFGYGGFDFTDTWFDKRGRSISCWNADHIARDIDIPSMTTTFAPSLTTPKTMIARGVVEAEKKKKSTSTSELAASEFSMVTSGVCRYNTPAVDAAGLTSQQLAAVMPCSETMSFGQLVKGEFQKATAVFASPWKNVDHLHSTTHLGARDISIDHDSKACTLYKGAPSGPLSFKCGESFTTLLPRQVVSFPATASAEALAAPTPSMAVKGVAQPEKVKKCKWTQTLDYAVTTMVMKTKVSCSMTSDWVSWRVPKTIHVGTVVPVTSQPMMAEMTPAPLLDRDAADANRKKKCDWAQTLDYDNTKLTYKHDIPCTMFTSWSNMPMPSSVHVVPPQTTTITSWTSVTQPPSVEVVFPSTVTSTFDVVVTTIPGAAGTLEPKSSPITTPAPVLVRDEAGGGSEMEKKCKWTYKLKDPKLKTKMELPCSASSALRAAGMPNPVKHWSDMTISYYFTLRTPVSGPAAVPSATIRSDAPAITPAPVFDRAVVLDTETEGCSWTLTLDQPAVSKAMDIPCSAASSLSSRRVPNPANPLTEPALLTLIPSSVRPILSSATALASNQEASRLVQPTAVSEVSSGLTTQDNGDIAEDVLGPVLGMLDMVHQAYDDYTEDHVKVTDSGNLALGVTENVIEMLHDGYDDWLEHINGKEDDFAEAERVSNQDTMHSTTLQPSMVVRDPQSVAITPTAPPQTTQRSSDSRRKSKNEKIDLGIAAVVPVCFVAFICLIRKFWLTRTHEDMADAEDLTEKGGKLGDGQPISNVNYARGAGAATGTIAGSVA
ncbi:hypothetical protein Slin14017_G061010 [Septoria linicola]|nr:hypothetical protein Slin14017_G061010 [Septoria linicola]